MSLTPGTKLGPYEILAPLGAGGMGEVYKAKDTRLDRTVAIKVLPSHVASHPEVRQRFEREARAVSSLNHPNICTLHDIGSENGIDFMVMEHIEGDTLADRLKKGALPLDQALQYGIEIADALDKAHRQGVVHRDLKPGNIMLTKSGAKLLDFGLAKMSVAATNAGGLSALPTEAQPLTKEGSILGTFQYMAPEQLEGKEADARTDIFAFGAVLYEMVTGKKAFEGDSTASLIAAIMSSEPRPVSELRAVAPAALDRVVKKCLAKDPEDRWHTAHDLMDEVKWIGEGGRAASKAETSMVRRSIPGGLALVLLGAVLAGVVVWSLTRPAPLPLKRFAIRLPPGDEFVADIGGLSISPDGQNLVYVARSGGGTSRLHLRPIDQLEATPLPGTDGARGPFFSPDGQWVGFHAGGELKKVSITGGAPLTLCNVVTFFGASWGPDDTIFFSRSVGSELFRVSASGGTPEPVTVLDPEEKGHPRWPEILPGGKALLYTIWRSARNTSIVVQSLETGERRILAEGGSNPHYVPTGHIVFQRANSLLAMPFDLERLEVAGSSVPVLEDVGRDIIAGDAGQFSLSKDGSLLYASGTLLAIPGELVWVDRHGVEQPVAEGLRGYFDPRLSPDGQRLAVSIVGENGYDVWVFALGRGTLTRLTFGGTSIRFIWSRDGERVIFGSNRGGGDFNIFSKLADGSGTAEQLTTGAYRVPTSISSDGKTIVFRQNSDITGRDIGMVRLEGESEPEMLLQTPFEEHTGMLSPDDRWLTYVSNESGREEIYVRPFPDLGGKWQVSTDGGTEPMWSRDGRELFYRNGDKMMAVAISTEPELAPGKPTLLFEGRYLSGVSAGNPATNYDVAPDGRFVMIRTAEGSGLTQINVVLNWLEELKRLVPTN